MRSSGLASSQTSSSYSPAVALETAPQSFVTLTRIVDPAERGRFQRDLAERFGNVSTLDLSCLQEALERLVQRVVLAIRFMALFSLGVGILVLIGALATSRFQRVRGGRTPAYPGRHSESGFPHRCRRISRPGPARSCRSSGPCSRGRLGSCPLCLRWTVHASGHSHGGPYAVHRDPDGESSAWPIVVTLYGELHWRC